jgi:chaperonin GroES
MIIEPISDHILLEPLVQKEKTESGLFIPETAKKESPEQGKVITVGPGRKTKTGQFIPMEIKKGDRVLFTKFGPSEIEVENKIYLIAKEEDLLAILK